MTFSGASSEALKSEISLVACPSALKPSTIRRSVCLFIYSNRRVYFQNRARCCVCSLLANEGSTASRESAEIIIRNAQHGIHGHNASDE